MSNGHDDDTFGRAYDDGLGPDGSEGLQLPPWERRDRFGLLNALYLTVKDVLLAPQRFFHRMPTSLGLLQPLIFAALLGVFSAFFGWMWSLAGSSLQILISEDLGKILSGPLHAFLSFLISPLRAPLQVLVVAAVIHGCLWLVRGNRLGFEATCRVVAYAKAVGVLALLPPICAQTVAPLWGLVVLVIGLYAIHETQPWRAMVAVLAPVVIGLLSHSSLVARFFLGMN